MSTRRLTDGVSEFEVRARYEAGRLRFDDEGEVRELEAVSLGPGRWLLRDEAGRTHTVQVARRRNRWWVHLGGRTYVLEEPVRGAGAAAAGSLIAPMNGKVEGVFVQEGEEVEAGELLLTLSAMKMQIEVKAPHDGVVTALFHGAGEQVEGGSRLAVVDPATEPDSA